MAFTLKNPAHLQRYKQHNGIFLKLNLTKQQKQAYRLYLFAIVHSAIIVKSSNYGRTDVMLTQ